MLKYMKTITLLDRYSLLSFFILMLGYIGISYFILSLTVVKTFIFYLSIIFFGVVFSLVCNWIFDRKHYSYEMHKIIGIPIMIAFIVINHKLLNSITL